MANEEDGGPAFPSAPALPMSSGKQRSGDPGMSLRDYFASDALKGMLSSAPVADRTKIKKDIWAGVAYEFADAMLKAREL